MPDLKQLDLSDNLLIGDFIDFEMDKLQELYLDSNHIRLNGELRINSMKSLAVLGLSNIGISGELWISISINSKLKLDLSFNSLTGIDGSAGSLTQLDLRSNKLESFPDFHAPNLEALFLSRNNIQGTLPALGEDIITIYGEIVLFPQLWILAAQDNQISGTIPDFNLPKLWRLSLASNQLTGTIPPFTKSSSLESLSLANNNISGTIPNFEYTPNLEELNLASNKLEGKIPVLAPKRLSSLNLEGNLLHYPKTPLTGLYSSLDGVKWKNNRNWLSNVESACNWFGVECYSDCPEAQKTGSYCPVRSIHLISNGLAGDIGAIQIFDQLSDLKSLDFSSNNLQGNIPILPNSLEDVNLEQNPNLYYPRQSLSSLYQQTKGGTWKIQTGWLAESLSVCEWHGIRCVECPAVQKQMSYCPISEILLPDNSLDGNIGSEQLWDRFPQLTKLDLSTNSLSGHIPVYRSQSLQVLKLERNILRYPVQVLKVFFSQFGGEKWSSKTNWNSEQNICEWEGIDCHNSCSSTQKEMSYCPITGIMLPNNKLSGELVSLEWIDFNVLESLDLSNNSLTGTLTQFEENKFLKNIILSNNNLEGQIPEMRHLTEMERLILSGNKFSGNLPSFSWNKLKSLEIARNGMTGTIGDLSSLPELVELDLSDNSFEGFIPIMKPVGLRYINLDGNQFSYPKILLDEFYAKTGGDFWHEKSNWTNSYSSICNRFGVECYSDCPSAQVTYSYCPIKAIVLPNNNLSGGLNGNWTSGLIELQKFDVSQNRIQGTVPDFKLLKKLNHIDLSNNILRGSLPQFADLFDIEYLGLSGNQFSGLVPDYRHLRFLNTIRINGSKISSLEILQGLFLSTKGENWLLKENWNLPLVSICDWHGIVCEEQCSTVLRQESLCPVLEINLANNNLQGAISGFAMNFVERIKLTGNLLTSLSDINTPSLMHLDISNNKIKQISRLIAPNLIDFTISGNMIDYLGNLQIESLPGLFIANQNISGIVENISASNLQIMDIRDNRIEIVRNISAPGLFMFLASRNLLYGISDFAFPSVLIMRLDNNKIEKLPSFSGCQQMTILDASHNKLISIEAQSLSSLETLDLSYNRLEGPLAELNNPNLDVLDLSNNALKYPLPEWRNLTKLTKLDLFNNTLLRGSLPKGMDDYSSISTISLLGTSMASTVDNLLPKVLQPSQSYRLENTGETFQCPVIINPSVLRPQIDVPPSYHQNIFCNCIAGYFGFGGKCIKCPETGVCGCNDGVTLDGCFFTPNVQHIVDIIPCLDPDACKFKIPEDAENRTRIYAHEYEFECQPGYMGRGCYECEEGYVFDGSQCQECSTEYTVVTMIIFVLVLLFGIFWQVGLAWIGEVEEESAEAQGEKDSPKDELKEESHESARIDIFLFYTQILQIIGGMMNLPESNLLSQTVASLASFTIPSLDCMIGNKPHIVSILNLLRIPGITLIGYYILTRYIKLKDSKSVKKVVAVMFTFLEATYFSVAKDVISAYGCTLYDPGLDSWFLNAYPWIECSPMSDEFAMVIATSIPGLIYLFAYPYLIYSIMKSGNPKESKVILVAQRKSSTTLATKTNADEGQPSDQNQSDVPQPSIAWGSTNLEDSQNQRNQQNQQNSQNQQQVQAQELDLGLPAREIIFIIQKQRMDGTYEKDYNWWAVVQIVQSLLFGFSAFFIPYTRPTILYLTIFVWIQTAITMQSIYNPYVVDSDDRFSTYSWLTLYISFFCALLMQLVPGNYWLSWVILFVNVGFTSYFITLIWPDIKEKILEMVRKNKAIFPERLFKED
eukprot:TRINITY_DN10353_c0_g1_i2.p1 TRINITY_DN10353_c0_g1~~TRINITY_DN10353_c0_g1_i2.p1  ORF type:complete len:1781 (-),score=259.55 TRINITY_DN10353_c0_g1_i2:151-5493(-)